MIDDESPYVSPEDEADIIENVEQFIESVESCAFDNSKDQLKFSAYEINFGKPKVSLQKAFLDYKWKRSKELMKHVDVPYLPKHSEEDKLKLRNLFIKQAKTYIGVPYSKKYWTPEDPEFRAPLFLDCCGLVRRVMLDLKREFGFCLGPWNQGYQYDTLPITLQSLDEVKPGDLVFTAATYYKPREKPQKHDLTHVEILLGSGARTIASRWRKGKVQEFDDYRFESTVYHSPKYIFKSIETWIQGICKSHCEEHRWVWRSGLFIPTDKSIFSSKYDCDSDNDSELNQNEMMDKTET